MAGIVASAVTGLVSTGGAGDVTVQQIVAAANHRVIVKMIDIAFSSVDNTDTPIEVYLSRQTDAGTMSALTPVKWDETDDETLQTTAQHTATGEPTTGDAIYRTQIHPQGGIIQPFRYDLPITIKGGGRLGVIVDDKTNTVNCSVTTVFEE